MGGLCTNVFAYRNVSNTAPEGDALRSPSLWMFYEAMFYRCILPDCTHLVFVLAPAITATATPEPFNVHDEPGVILLFNDNIVLTCGLQSDLSPWMEDSFIESLHCCVGLSQRILVHRHVCAAMYTIRSFVTICSAITL